MRFKGILNYNDIEIMCGSYRELEEQDRSTALTEWLADYCEYATAYADLMKKAGIRADFLFDSLQGIPVGIGEFHKDNLKNGMTPQESFELVKTQIAGYLMFTLRNCLFDDGWRADFEVNDDNSGLCLNVDDGAGESFVLDIPGLVNKAFRYIRLEDGDIFCNAAAVMNVLLKGWEE